MTVDALRDFDRKCVSFEDDNGTQYDINTVLKRLLNKMKQHGIYSKNGYTFLWEDGREYDPDYITKLFKKAVKACDNVPKDITLHGLRHSTCAILYLQSCK